MSTIDIQAQQIVIDALASDPKNNQKTILCHTPSKLNAESGMYLSTQDRLQELFVNSYDLRLQFFRMLNLSDDSVENLMKISSLWILRLLVMPLVTLVIPMTLFWIYWASFQELVRTS